MPSLGTAISRAKPEDGGLASGIANPACPSQGGPASRPHDCCCDIAGRRPARDPNALTAGLSGIAAAGALVAAATLRMASMSAESDWAECQEAVAIAA
jgi:hypothetical protein